MKGSHPTAWFPLHIADFEASTRSFSNEEIGGYIRLLIRYWETGGPLRNDKRELKIITGLSSKKVDRLVEVFTEKAGFLHDARMDYELEKVQESVRKKQQRTLNARNARWPKRESMTDSVTEPVTEDVADSHLQEHLQKEDKSSLQ